jgi:uncharacterized Zn finger protein
MVRMAVSPPFTEADITRAADGRSFERGSDYLGAVEDLEIGPAEMTASVHGSSEYRVSLAFGEDGLTGDCTCPYGREGFFCKHCVAVALSVLKLGDGLPRHIEAARAGRRALESWLESLSREELLAEVAALVDGDRDLRRRLELRAATVNADTVTVRRAVRELIMLPRRGYVGWDEAYDYANDVHKAAAALDALIDSGRAADAIGIVREAMDLLGDALQAVDDSSGAVGEAGVELLGVHLRACEAARPDPLSLAAYLSGQLLHNDSALEPSLGDYAELLGGQGLAAVRQRVAAAYARDPSGWRAKHLMQDVARAAGDVDTVVAVHAADLDDRGWHHLLIARELDAAGRGAEALGWAERGLADAVRPDDRLVDYLADRYAAAGRDDDVLRLRSDRFRAERTLANYRALRRAAPGTWDAQRSQALALLREDARHLRVKVPWAWSGPVLVDALLDDGDPDAAWAAASETPATTDAQWLKLADALAPARPADALAAYLRVCESLKQSTGNDVYQRIATLLLAARGCHEALGTLDEFRHYVARLRADQKRKRNLMKILDQHGL